MGCRLLALWQKRLRCALFTEEPGLIETLQDDEVLQVRQAASSNLLNK